MQSAYYHSGGWRINPNLYEEGKVCLSLLNTWTGRGNEVWDPVSSSILQVLVSLQGLVLNSKPYFNEAGYDKQIGTAEGEKNSLAYNENTFLLNCKTMMYLMRRPPKVVFPFQFSAFFPVPISPSYMLAFGDFYLISCDSTRRGGRVIMFTNSCLNLVDFMCRSPYRCYFDIRLGKMYVVCLFFFSSYEAGHFFLKDKTKTK